MTDISALQSAVSKLKTTADAVLSEVKTSSTSSDVSQSDIDALVADVEGVETKLADANTSSPSAAADSAPNAGSSPAASAAADPATPASETVQPPWQASS